MGLLGLYEQSVHVDLLNPVLIAALIELNMWPFMYCMGLAGEKAG